MSTTEDTKKYRGTRTRPSSADALCDPYRATFKHSLIRKESFNKTVFVPSIEVRNPPVWRHTFDLEWDQMGPMLDVLSITRPESAAEHDEAAAHLAAVLRRWGRDNLKGQIGIQVVPRFVMSLHVSLELKTDLVKWKLAWHGL